MFLYVKKRKDEAQQLAGALLDAEAKIGEMLKVLPKAKNQYASCSGATSTETKESAVQRLGFEKTQAHRFEILADNPDIIEQVKAEAKETDRRQAPFRGCFFMRIVT